VDTDKCKEDGKNSICSMGGNSSIVHISANNVWRYIGITLSFRAIKKDLRGKYIVCPRHVSYFGIMR
jgi:hypothetical protein